MQAELKCITAACSSEQASSLALVTECSRRGTKDGAMEHILIFQSSLVTQLAYHLRQLTWSHQGHQGM
ncbi:hypothetical protein E2C01_053649 [Portunus trituberculatus]|uniref:Uncharacterized protein n=1 Tax=Portunus trituberculatus TaxID=210409 RepID=A0A5B7GQ09_PORTR|nr:hypothetical protein [Portunus trituberculatus]